MSADHLRIEDHTPRPGRVLLVPPQHSPAADQATAPEANLLRLQAEAGGAVVERARGALMLLYGIDSYQAFAVLVRWARETRTPLRTIAHTFLHGICEGNPATEIHHRPLIRWLEDQVRLGDPGLG